jgi:hypothetical protein
VDELVEDDTVGDAWPVAPQGMGVDMFGQQSGELVPQRVNEPPVKMGWSLMMGLVLPDGSDPEPP